MRHDVFISYTSEDTEDAVKALGALEENGVRCWIFPRDQIPGDNYPSALKSAIDAASVLVLIWSPEADTSEDVQNEVLLAIQSGLVVVPVRIRDFESRGDLGYLLIRRHWMKAWPAPLDPHLETLVANVGVILHRIRERKPPLKGIEGWTPKKNAFRSDPAESLSRIAARLPLHLPAPEKLATSQQPSFLLRPENALIELSGRTRETRLLEEFRDESGLFQWIVMVGEGGVGKTRLALEFCKKSVRAGWHAGFLHNKGFQRLASGPRFDEWTPTRNTLVVVDYAGAKDPQVETLIDRCAVYSRHETGSSTEDVPVIRVILLERQATLDGGWLERLWQSGEMSTRATIQSSFRQIIQVLPPGSDDAQSPFEQTKTIVAHTFEAWSRLHGSNPLAMPELGDGWKQVQHHTGNRPLYLQMAAIHACERGDARELPSWTRGELLRAAVERERQYIETGTRSAPQGTRDVLEYLTAVLCLTGLGITSDRAQWNRVLAEEIANPARGYNHLQPAAVDEYRRAIFPAGTGEPGNQRAATPIAPDILAEAFAATILNRINGIPVADLRRILELGGSDVWIRLIRLVQDLFGVRGFERVPEWLPALIEDRSAEELAEIAQVLPERTVALRTFAVHLFRKLLVVGTEESVAPEQRVEFMIRLSMHMDALGKKRSSQEALGIAQSAVEASQRLVEESGEAHLPLLGRAFHYLARVLETLDDRKATLRAVRRAVEIRERLAEEDRDRHALDLARSLNNLGNTLAGLGAYAEALTANERAAEIAEESARSNWRVGASVVARTLNTTAQRLQALGRADEALPRVSRSVRIREDLAQRNPDRYAHALTLSLGTMIGLQRQLGRKDETLATSERRVQILRDLGARDPERFGEESHRATLAHQGLTVEIVEGANRLDVDVPGLLGKDAIRHYREEHSALVRASEVMSHGVDLTRSRNWGAALSVMTQATELLRSASAGRGRQARRLLGMSLNNMAYILANQARLQDALRMAHEALEIWQELETGTTRDIAQQKSQTLDTMAVILSRLGRYTEAYELSMRVTEMYASLTSGKREVIEPENAEALRTLAEIQAKLDRLPEARESCRQAIQLALPHKETDPHRVEPLLDDLFALLKRINVLMRRDNGSRNAEGE